MNKLFSLVKLELEDSFNKSSKKNYALKTLIAIYIILMIVISLFINLLFASALAQSNYAYYYPLFLAIGVIIFTFFSSIYRVKATLFSPKDKNFLTPLPLTKSSIILAKLLLTYLEELIFSLIIFLPCVVLYSLIDLSFIFYGIVLVLTLPLFSLLLAFIIGFALQMLTLRLPWLKYVGTFIYIAFIFVMCFIYLILNNLDYDVANELTNITNIHKIFPFNIIYEGFIEHNILYFSCYLVVAIALSILFISVYSIFYDKIYEAMEYVGKKPKFTVKSINSNKVSFSIIKNDLKRLLNNQMFLISAIMPAILVLIIGLSFYFSLHANMDSLPDEDNSQALQSLYNIMPFVILLFFFLATYTSFSITLEGKTFWIVKTLPIKEKTYINVKLMENQLIIGVLTLIFTIVTAVLYNLSVLGIVFIVIVPQLYIYAIGVVGLCFNLKYPKLVWSSYRQVKNMASNVLTMLVGFVSGIFLVSLGIFLYFIKGEVIAYITLFGIVILMFVLAIVLSKTIAPKLLKRIDV